MKSLKDFKLSVQVGAGSSKVSYGPRRPAPMDLAVDPLRRTNLIWNKQQNLNLRQA